MMNATPDAIRAFWGVDNRISLIPGVEAVSQTWEHFRWAAMTSSLSGSKASLKSSQAT
jgi:hypothetical protein